MAGFRRVLACAALVLAPALVHPTIARADDEPAPESSGVLGREFSPSWFGARIGLYYRPEIHMNVQVSGKSAQAQAINGLLGTRIDIEKDLGVTQTVTSDYAFDDGILEGELFFDTRFVSVSFWGIAPYEYSGSTTLTRTVNFGGVQFSASTPVTSRFRQYHLGVDVKLNLLNNQFVRLSPIVSVRALAIDWEVKGAGFTGDTSSIDTPLDFADAKVLPYPEVGAEVRVGLRQWLELDARLTGSLIDYFGYRGETLTAEGGVTVYPLPIVGVRVGLRYMSYNIKSNDPNNAKDSYNFDLKYLGATVSLIVRFG
jgi:hypothetical protein